MTLEAYFYNLLETEEIGASFSAWKGEKEVYSLHGGYRDAARSLPWSVETLAPVWSATKGPMAAATRLALHRAGLDGNTEIRRIWPEFLNPHLTVGEVLSHQGGLAALDDPPSIFDRQAVIEALVRQKPHWQPPAHGYHPRTIGFLADEIVRRIDGRTLADFWQEEIANPHGIDFFIACPERESHRVATLISARPGKGGHPREFYRAFAKEDSLTRQAFGSPQGLTSAREMNEARSWSAGFPAMGGVGSARGLARFYQLLLSSAFDELLPDFTLRLSQGHDLIQCVPTSFSFGMMLDPLDAKGEKIRQLFGSSPSAFGHPGAGGSYAFGDPESGWSFAFVMNHFEANLYPNTSRLKLVDLAIEGLSQ